jgi:hypothetical protein
MADARDFIRIHDSIDEHPKIEALSDRAFRHLISLWCYCSRNLTDGHVAERTWKRLTSTKTARELLDNGLAEHENGGFVMHDYLEHQRSRADVEDLRAKRREAGSKGGKARASAQANASANGQQNPSREREIERDPSSPPARHTPAEGRTRDTTPARQLAATLLGITQDDPRLDHLPELFRANNVRAPGPWLRATAEAGDLESLLDIATDNATDPWAHLPRIGPA